MGSQEADGQSVCDRGSEQPGCQGHERCDGTAWGVRPFYRREGGSIGAVAMLQQICGVESVLVGMGLPSDNVHSPNEHHAPANLAQRASTRSSISLIISDKIWR
jgi:hypothetical protein